MIAINSNDSYFNHRQFDFNSLRCRVSKAAIRVIDLLVDNNSDKLKIYVRSRRAVLLTYRDSFRMESKFLILLRILKSFRIASNKHR